MKHILMHAFSMCSDVKVFQAFYNFVPVYPNISVDFEETIIN